MNPAEQTDQVKGPPGAGGAATVIPRSTYAQQNGMGNLVPGSQPASPFQNGGRLPSALLNPNRPAGAPAPSTAPLAAGGGGYASPLPDAAPNPAYATPPTPGGPAPAAAWRAHGDRPSACAASRLDAAGKASTDQWASQNQLVGGSAAARLYQLRTALAGLQTLGAQGIGPSAGTLNAAKSYLLSLPVVGQNLGIDPNKIATYDEVNKYLTAYASARAAPLGGLILTQELQQHCPAMRARTSLISQARTSPSPT